MSHWWRSVRSNRDLEWTLALSTAWLGLWADLPSRAFTTSLLAMMERWGGEQVWGAYMLASGLLHLSALWINGARSWTPRLRLVVLFTGLAGYGAFAVAVWHAAWSSIAMAMSIVMIGWTLHCIRRAAADARIAEARRNVGLPT